jgi:Tol biopolymer transport system component
MRGAALPGLDERLKSTANWLAEEVESGHAFDRVWARKIRRRFLHRVGVVGLVVAVLAGTVGGTFALAMVFRSDRRPAPAGRTTQPTALPPTGNGLIAFVSNRDGNNEIYVMNPNGTAVTRLTHDPAYDSSPAWSPDSSKITFAKSAGLGDSGVPIENLFVMNADGTRETNLTRNPPGISVEVGNSAWSPDGTRIAFEQQLAATQTTEIYLINPDGSGLKQLTHDPMSAASPVWSPDGSRIAFFSDDGLSVMNADGTERITLVQRNLDYLIPRAWSPGGSTIAFVRVTFGPTEADVYTDIYLVDADGSTERRLTSDRASQSPAWSPDGKKIAFSSARDGNAEIYLMNSNGTDVIRLTEDPAEDTEPAW